jgi:pimeloyl-ACP methyl ester carboxylesterase
VDLSALDMPIYTVGAELDALVPPAYVEAFARATGAEYRFLPGQGHGMTLDHVWQDVVEGLET